VIAGPFLDDTTLRGMHRVGLCNIEHSPDRGTCQHFVAKNIVLSPSARRRQSKKPPIVEVLPDVSKSACWSQVKMGPPLRLWWWPIYVPAAVGYRNRAHGLADGLDGTPQ
jgi:hypothetical protein